MGGGKITQSLRMLCTVAETVIFAMPLSECMCVMYKLTKSKPIPSVIPLKHHLVSLLCHLYQLLLDLGGRWIYITVGRQIRHISLTTLNVDWILWQIPVNVNTT